MMGVVGVKVGACFRVVGGIKLQEPLRLCTHCSHGRQHPLFVIVFVNCSIGEWGA